MNTAWDRFVVDLVMNNHDGHTCAAVLKLGNFRIFPFCPFLTNFPSPQGRLRSASRLLVRGQCLGGRTECPRSARMQLPVVVLVAAMVIQIQTARFSVD
ncbi:hypothetical protein PAXRUDRAFT_725881 [Paxillus rubicundulus Ve08.2h10]|uniref:Uncharacterized protein n=1 Tax=Paxillus rubicundulus Ve08.2h10 TaxID=930991 RepID=A0A0D0D2C2_9AGAM|nr:hypothetical protein PAXRUDRAFT_725881 [Paxillus rubicundulus Ve08.2h10]